MTEITHASYLHGRTLVHDAANISKVEELYYDKQSPRPARSLGNRGRAKKTLPPKKRLVPLPNATRGGEELRLTRLAHDRVHEPHIEHAATARRRAELFADAMVVLQARYADCDLRLEDVARQVATSARQLQRVFVEVAHSTFRDELTGVRMRAAERLLAETALPIKAIALRVGYRHAAHFAKAFRRHHALAPTAFRRATASAADALP